MVDLRTIQITEIWLQCCLYRVLPCIVFRWRTGLRTIFFPKMANCAIDPTNIPFDAQSIPQPRSVAPGQSAVYRAYNAPADLLSDDGTGVRTLWENFKQGLAKNANGNMLGHRPLNRQRGTHEMYYKWQTYRQVADRVVDVASGMVYLLRKNCPDAPPVYGKQLPIGFYSVNRPEWVIADIACSRQSLVNVSLYDTLGPNAVEYVMNHSEISLVFASADKIATLLSISDKLHQLKIIVSMDALTDPLPTPPAFSGQTTTSNVLHTWAKQKNILLLDIYELERIGLEHPQAPEPPAPTDLATVNYTSGNCNDSRWGKYWVLSR